MAGRHLCGVGNGLIASLASGAAIGDGVVETMLGYDARIQPCWMVSAMSEALLERDPLSMDGAARFPGTRISVGIFLGYLARGVSVEEFCGPSYYPYIKPDHCHAVLEHLRELADTADDHAVVPDREGCRVPTGQAR